MKTEITMSVFLPNEPIQEVITDEIANIAGKYGVTFFKNVVKTYNFSELSEGVQKQLIEKEQNDPNRLCHDWYESTLDYWKERLESIGFEDAEIRFSGFWSQGDGASFVARIDTEKVLNALLMCEEKITETRIGFYNLWFALRDVGILSLDMHRTDSRYCHENTISCSVDVDFGGLNNRMWVARDPKKPFELSSIFEDKCQVRFLEDMLNGFVKDICREIYGSLEEEYQYLHSEEYIRGYLDDGEDRYDEYGNLA